jgi:hypothetical protein
MKWTKIADILKSSKLGKNFTVGYQMADFNGYLCRQLLILCSTADHRKGFMVLDVQWYTGVVCSLSEQFKK